MVPTHRLGFEPDKNGGRDEFRHHRRVGVGHSESTPVETALPTFTPQREAVDAKCVVEVGSPGLDPGGEFTAMMMLKQRIGFVSQSTQLS